MYIYADESGNTGKNIFDKPERYALGAILTSQDIESDLEELVEKLCKKFYISKLHANSLDVDQNLEIANSVLDFVQDADFKLFICSIYKPYLSTTKFIDTLFDNAENKAVPPLWYQFEFFRHYLCLIFEELLDDIDKRLFWTSYLESNVDLYIKILNIVRERLSSYELDSRTYQVINDSLNFAIRFPEKIVTISTKKKYKFETPNMIAFALLMIQIREFCEKNSLKPCKFIHDRQNEFQGSMKKWHEDFQKVKYDESIPGIMQPKDIKYDLGEIQFESSNENVMLQIIDNLVWVYQCDKIEDSHDIKKRLASISEHSEISPEYSYHTYQLWEDRLSNVSQEKADIAKTFVDEWEEKRIEKLRNFYESKKDK